MTLPVEQRLQFFVFVIESPSPADLYHRRSEGEIVQQAVGLNQIPCTVRTAINLEAFEASLKIGLAEEMEALKGLVPILHISAHGHQEGIQLSSGEIISWAELRLHLQPINQALNNGLLVCLSSCEGFAGARMAMFLDDQNYPFFAIVANADKPLWSDTAVAYSAFYHIVAKGHTIIDAVNAMQVASGNQSFWVQTAEQARQGYIEYINNVDTHSAQETLEENANNETPETLERLRKVM